MRAKPRTALAQQGLEGMGREAMPFSVARYAATLLARLGGRDEAADSGGALREDQGAGAPGGLERPPWHERHAVRRARAVAAVLVVAGGVAAVPYPRYVTEECVVLPVRRLDVRADVEAVVKAIRVEEGGQVHAGDVIAELSDPEIEGALAEAVAAVESQRANVEKLRRGSRDEEIARSRALTTARGQELEFARREWQRAQRSFAAGLASGAERDRAAHDLEMKRIGLEQARADQRLVVAGFRAEELAIGEAELRRAEARRDHYERLKGLLTLRAPFDGWVTTPRLYERVGVKLGRGDTLCEIADNTRSRVEILVPEREVDVVAVGQKTAVKVHSFPLVPFEGRVQFVAPAVASSDGRRYVRVVTELENSAGALRGGMTGYGEIETGQTRLGAIATRRLIRWIRVRFLV